MGDIMHLEGGLHDWESLPSTPQCAQLKEQQAYEHLTESVNLTRARVTKSEKCKKILITNERVHEGTIVWEFEIKARQMAEKFRMGQTLTIPSRTFRVDLRRLIPKLAPPPEDNMQLTRIMTGLPKTTTTGKHLILIGHL